MKEIPVYLEGRFIEMVKEAPLLVHILYNRWRKIYGVRKVLYERGKRVDMENRYRPPYEVRGI